MRKALLADSLFFKAPDSQKIILNNISFSLNYNSILCLAGVNGSGKSTLLTILAGLYSPSGGELNILGTDFFSKDAQSKNQARHKISLLVQDADMQILGTTVKEDLMLSFCPNDKKNHESNFKKAQKTAHSFSLLDKWDSSVDALSYGQKRKLCLAGALLRDPKLLLLDEPFSGLDYPGILELLKVLKNFKKSGMAIVVSSHDISLLKDIADAYLFLSPTLPSLWGREKDLFPRAKDYGIRA